jgi:hypothetical protein
MSATADVDLIRQMLDEGQLAREDEAGHQRELHAQCPTDRTEAPVHRVVRTDHKVTEVIFRCPSCGQDFSAPPEAMRLA